MRPSFITRPVGNFQRFFLIVGDEDAGDVHFVVQLAQPAAQFLPDFGVQRAERFVEQQDLGSTARARASATRWRWPPESCEG